MKFFECFLCRRPCTREEWLCLACHRDLGKQLHPRSYPPESLQALPLLSFGNYDGVWARIIKTAKAQPCGYLGGELDAFLRTLCEHWAPELREFQADGIVSVPSHPIRSFVETDLSARLGAELARALKIPVRHDLIGFNPYSLLERAPQKNLKRAERLTEGRNKRFRTRKLEPEATAKRLLLVDDVCATGSSLRACRELLAMAGFEVVAHVVFARSQAVLPQPRVAL